MAKGEKKLEKKIVNWKKKNTKMDKMYMSLMVGILGLFVLMGSVNAFTHIVGGSHGWRVPDNVTFFDQWATPRTFGVGDRLGMYIFSFFFFS